jgi:hypothetical protein
MFITEKNLDAVTVAARMNGISAERARMITVLSDLIDTTETEQELTLLHIIYLNLVNGPQDIP